MRCISRNIRTCRIGCRLSEDEGVTIRVRILKLIIGATATRWYSVKELFVVMMELCLRDGGIRSVDYEGIRTKDAGSCWNYNGGRVIHRSCYYQFPRNKESCGAHC